MSGRNLFNANALLDDAHNAVDAYGLPPETFVTATVLAANAEATLALVEEQRTANLLAWRAAIVGTFEHNQLMGDLSTYSPELYERFNEVSAEIRERLDLPPLPKN